MLKASLVFMPSLAKPFQLFLTDLLEYEL